MRPRPLCSLLGFLSLLITVLVTAPPVSAGGWAVTTLDLVPAPAAGQTISVGFTIRQHGVTPVHLDRDVGIEVRSPSGQVDYFPASPAGPVGHYVTEVAFREQGDSTWSVRQGWFAPQDLGIVVVAPGHDVVAVTRHRWPSIVRFGLPGVAILLGAFAIVDARRGRRRLVTA